MRSSRRAWTCAALAEATAVRVLPFGDDALLIELDTVVSVRAARRARLLAAAVERLRLTRPELGVPVAGAASVLVPFAPLLLEQPGHGGLERIADLAVDLAALADDLPADPQPERDAACVEIPTRFGGDAGPDLDTVAAETGLTAAAVVDLLAAAELEVLFLGFAPGFAYLGELPGELIVPRLAVPRTRVPAGTMAIAGRFAGIYPQTSAGGWRLLGRTEVTLFNPTSGPPVLLRPGDRVRLVPR